MPPDLPTFHGDGLPDPDDLRDLVGSAAIGLHFVDARGIILWANPADYETLGYSAAEYIGHSIVKFHADADVIQDILRRLTAGERLLRYEARLVCKDGTIRWVEITSSVRFAHSEGKQTFIHTRCFTQDISERKRLEEAQKLLLQAGQLLAHSLDVDETLRTLARLTVPRFADWYAVHLVNAQGDIEPVHIAHRDPDKTELAWQAVKRWPHDRNAPQGLPHTIRTGASTLMTRIKPELLETLARDPVHLSLLQEAGLHSSMVVPLRLDGRTIGAMTFVTAESKRSYDAADLEVAESLASRTAMAIGNARLHQEALTARRRAERAAQRLDLLSKASAFIAESLEPDEALRQLARFAATTLADYCITYAQDADGLIRRVGLAHADSRQQELVKALGHAGKPQLTDAFGVGAVLREGQSTLTPEISEEMLTRAANNPEHLRILLQLAPRSSLIVPLRARQRTLGALTLATTDHSGRRFDHADLTLAEELAGRVALLVDNARLYSETKASEQAKEQILSVVSHDLRSPLHTIVMAVELLEMDPSPAERERTRASIARATTEMNRLLQDLLDAIRIREGRLRLRLEPADVESLLTHLVELHTPAARDRSIRLTTRLPVPTARIQVDFGRIGQALSNMVDNSLKYAPAGSEVMLSADSDGTSVLISVEDNGPGIAADELTHIFERFWRADTQQHSGLGLGLAIAKGVVEAHGGSIGVVNIPEGGCRFTVELPALPPGDD